MNLLLDQLPTTVTIDNKEYRINTNFRISILFELLIQDVDLNEEEKLIRALELYYPIIPRNLNEAVEKILWFYSCNKEIKQSKGTGITKNTQIYSFKYDDDYIYAAFLAQYGLDLQCTEHLHWWKFKAMFKALKGDDEIVKIMGYRAINLSKIKDKEQKAYYKNMKELYKLPSNVSKDTMKKINDIEEALLNTGDLTNIL